MHQSDVALDVCGDVQEVVTESAKYGRSDPRHESARSLPESSAADLSRVAFGMRNRESMTCAPTTFTIVSLSAVQVVLMPSPPLGRKI